MASQSSISMSPDPEVVEEVATEMGISSAFVEKDCFSMSVLKAIAANKWLLAGTEKWL